MIQLTVGSAARNDGYGDRASDRFRFHLSSMDDFAHGLGVPMEHLIVDWNSVAGSTLEGEFGLPEPHHHTRRWAVVEGEQIDRIVERAGRPFVEQAAKNALIERAAGHWLLIVNSDVALSFALGAAVGSVIRSGPSAGMFVRADRLDVRYRDDEGLPDRVDLRDSVGRASVLHRRHGDQAHIAPSAPVQGLSSVEMAALASCPRPLDVDFGPSFLCLDTSGPVKGLHTNASGDFCLAPTDLWRSSGGFAPTSIGYGHGDSLMIATLAAHGARQVVLRFPLFVVHVEHDDRDAPTKYGSFSRVEAEFNALLDGYQP